MGHEDGRAKKRDEGPREHEVPATLSTTRQVLCDGCAPGLLAAVIRPLEPAASACDYRNLGGELHLIGRNAVEKLLQLFTLGELMSIAIRTLHETSDARGLGK